MRTGALLAILLLGGLLGGCRSLEQGEAVTLEQLQSDVMALKREIAAAEAQDDSRAEAATAELKNMVGMLAASVDDLDARVARTCATEAPAAADCSSARQVVLSGDKMLLGEVENVWVDPPGFRVSARVDTGAESSSLHAANITEFERDSENWVRFDVVFDELNVTIERPILKYVRVFQQSDKEGTRRAVVAMRIFLGDLQDTYEFTLADRSHLEHIMILGRNFLTDVALVDVSRKFVQPDYQPQTHQARSG